MLLTKPGYCHAYVIATVARAIKCMLQTMRKKFVSKIAKIPLVKRCTSLPYYGTRNSLRLSCVIWGPVGDSVTVKTLDLRSRGRGFDSRLGRYQMVITQMSDCLRTGKPFRYISNTKVDSAFHSFGVMQIEYRPA